MGSCRVDVEGGSGMGYMDEEQADHHVLLCRSDRALE